VAVESSSNGREAVAEHPTRAHFSYEWYGIGNDFIPSGFSPGVFPDVLPVLEIVVVPNVMNGVELSDL